MLLSLTVLMFQQNKDDEITMLRGLVRQQEDATRLLGEKLRNEAQEHVNKGELLCFIKRCEFFL